jgi:hypothetical protein
VYTAGQTNELFCGAVGPFVRVWEDYILPLEDMLIVEEQ